MFKAKILLVDDEEEILRTLSGSLEDDGYELWTAKDGIEAMAYLRHEGDYADAPRPDLILLDLNMPRKDGREVLTEIKQDEDLRSIPIVVLTTSDSDQDVLKSYDLQANCYITKPVNLEQFTRVFRSIKDFWLGVVKLPPR